MANYPTTDHTFEALNNLSATKVFVSFDSIYNEVKRIRLVKGLKAEDKNTKGRIRRSLVNTKSIANIRGSEQSKKLSINIKYPNWEVVSESEIQVSSSGLANVKQIEANLFMLVNIND